MIRISDHAQESQFFGTVPASFAEFKADEGGTEQRVWEDGRCHQKRGLPKLSVAEIRGSIIKGPEESIAILARPRHIGLPVPADEVMAGKRLPGGWDDVGLFMATRSQTTQSHLFVDLKLYILRCDLSVDPR